MIVTLTLNPSVDRALVVPGLDISAGRALLTAESAIRQPSGKGLNVSLCLDRLGVPSVAVAMLGRGDLGLYDDALAKTGIHFEPVVCEEMTRGNTTILDPARGVEIHIKERGFAPAADDLKRLSRALAVAVSRAATEDPDGIRPVLAVAGSLPPGLRPETAVEILRPYADSTSLVIDGSGEFLRESLSLNPSLIIPNDDELAELTGEAVDSATKARRAAERALDMGAQRVLVTRGDAGALLFSSSRTSAHPAIACDAPSVDVISTVGAGDAALAGFLWKRTEGEEAALQASVACGAAACLHPVPGILTAENVKRLLAECKTRAASR